MNRRRARFCTIQAPDLCENKRAFGPSKANDDFVNVGLRLGRREAVLGQERPVAMAVQAGLRLQRTSEPNFNVGTLVDLNQCGKDAGDR